VLADTETGRWLVLHRTMLVTPFTNLTLPINITHTNLIPFTTVYKNIRVSKLFCLPNDNTLKIYMKNPHVSYGRTQGYLGGVSFGVVRF